MAIIPGPDGGRLELREVPDPEPKPEELFIRVKATAVNRADVYQLQGTYPKPAAGSDASPTIAGLECAGEVAGMGEKVTGWSAGDRAMAMCQGGYAELATVDYRLAVRVPGRFTWEEAAAIPVSFMTEHNALITNGRLQKGESVLIHAVSSGAGVAAVQIAKLFGAKPVIGTGGNQTKLDAVGALGLDLGINHHRENFAEAVLAATKNAGVNLIIDHVGAPYLQDNLRCLALKGRLVSVGRLAGKAAPIDLDYLALKRLHLIGVTFRTRTLDERIAIARLFAADLLPGFEDGRLRPVVDRVFPLPRAAEAQAYMAGNLHLGKIVLTIP